MRKFLIFLLMALLPAAADAENSFEKKVAELLDTINSSGYERLDDFIHPQTGLYVTYELGAYRVYKHFDSGRDFRIWQKDRSGFYADGSFCKNCAFSDYKVQQGVPPFFDLYCGGDKEEPKDNVLFIENTGHQTDLTDYFKNYSREQVEEFNGYPLSDDVIKKIQFIESRSHRVASVNHDFMIYMTLIDSEWYLTVLATDKSCDA